MAQGNKVKEVIPWGGFSNHHLHVLLPLTKLPCHIIFIHHSSWFRGKYLACRDETMVSLLIGTLVWDANAACQEDQDHIVPVTYCWQVCLPSLFSVFTTYWHILHDFCVRKHHTKLLCSSRNVPECTLHEPCPPYRAESQCIPIPRELLKDNFTFDLCSK